jgi:hypothetical protein
MMWNSSTLRLSTARVQTLADGDHRRGSRRAATLESQASRAHVYRQLIRYRAPVVLRRLGAQGSGLRAQGSNSWS